MSDETKRVNLAHAMFAYHEAENEYGDAMVDAGFGSYHGIRGDWYDNSIEFDEVAPDARMSDEAQRITFDAGFSKAYVNHTDAWETHYTWDRSKPFAPARGWRRRWVVDKTASTSRGIGHHDPGYWEISYWPEGWGERSKSDLAKGYFRIVPDSPTPGSGM